MPAIQRSILVLLLQLQLQLSPTALPLFLYLIRLTPVAGSIGGLQLSDMVPAGATQLPAFTVQLVKDTSIISVGLASHALQRACPVLAV